MSANPDPNPILTQVMIRKQYDIKHADVCLPRRQVMTRKQYDRVGWGVSQP